MSPSGVAITCLAIILSCRNDAESTIQHMLTLLRDTLTCSCPVVEFETLSLPSRGIGAATARRCTSPLSVFVSGRNCATRITSSISRHLLDTVAFSLSLSWWITLFRVYIKGGERRQCSDVH